MVKHVIIKNQNRVSKMTYSGMPAVLRAEGRACIDRNAERRVP